MSKGPGKIQQKILAILLAGSSLTFKNAAYGYFEIVKMKEMELRKENKYKLKNSLKGLQEQRLISIKENPDNTITVVLLDKGRVKALTYQYGNLKKRKFKKWDKLWRLVIFDIPEKKRKVRDSLRLHLKQIGFYELQKSVFINPYDYQDEIDFIIELHNIRKYVRILLIKSVDNELFLKKYFNVK